MYLDGITAGYHGRARVHGVTLRFEKGTVTAIVGPNGSGKSTLIKAACGLLPLMAGQVTLGGRKMSEYRRLEWARAVSYLPQSRNIPNIPVESLVLHGRFPHMGYPRRYIKEDIQLAQRAMERVGLLPLAGRSMAEISGGERQKAYIAMAIAQDSGTLFLDEPTTYLDIGHQLDIMALARSLAAEGRAVIMVMHDLGMALAHSDQLALMSEGHLIGHGPSTDPSWPDALQRTFGVRIIRDILPDGQTAYRFEKG